MQHSHFVQKGLHRLLSSARRWGRAPTPFLILVSIQEQRLFLLRGSPAPSSYELLKSCRISTSRYGIGQEMDSNCTPLGLHQVKEKIGAGCMLGTVFWGRKPTGLTWAGLAGAPIVHRILWLDGLEPGFNRGGRQDSHDRYIYIHGTGEEMNLGRPASKGCVQMSSQDLIPLFNQVPSGTLVWIDRY